MDDRDAFVIMVSDGLWDCISNEEAVNIVHDTGVQFSGGQDIGLLALRATVYGRSLLLGCQACMPSIQLPSPKMTVAGRTIP